MPPPPRPGPVRYHDDPQRGRWGGLSERDGRRLEARLREWGKDSFHFDLVVSATDGTAVRGPVRFHLHDSFARAVQTIRTGRGDGTVAWEEIDAYETFTAAAQVRTRSGEWVGLEYDLAVLAADAHPQRLPLKFVPNRQRPFVRWLRERKTMIPGIALKDIHAQIVDAFKPPANLGREVQFRLNVNLAAVVNASAPLDDVVFDLLQWADGQGRLGELVRELAAARPQHAGLQTVAREYARLLTPASDPKEYVHFFDNMPAVELQEGGVSKGVAPVQDAGFEITRNKALGYFDATFFATMLGRNTARVCRVELNDADNTMGTAFLVGPRAVLTNYHVLEKVIRGTHPADKVKFRFDYFKAAPDSPPSDGIQLGLFNPVDQKRWLLGHSRYSQGEADGTPDTPPPTAGELDYALVRLDRAIGSEANSLARGWVELPQSPPSADKAPLLMILQHPNREPVKLAFDSDPQARVLFGGLRVRYQVNTEGGSSGSPVFDKEWRLVALHHYGDPSWKAGYNQGVPVGPIYQHLSADARKELGGQVEMLPRLEVAVATTAALSKRFEAGAAGVSPDDVQGIVLAAAAAAVANPLSVLPKLSERERGAIDGKIKEADDEWYAKFTGSNDPVEWQKATDRKKMLVCNALKQAKQLNGGQLPDDWVKLWVDLNCGV